MGVNLVAEGVFEGDEEVLVGGEEQSADADKPADEAATNEPSFETLLASASVEQGARSFRKCQACHTAENGAGNRIGPNLYGVVGNNVAHRDDFAYSSAMSEHGGTWTFDALNEFLSGPAAAVPGTKMTFAGLRNPQERANVIAYLNQQSDSPVPLPEAPAEQPAADQASGE